MFDLPLAALMFPTLFLLVLTGFPVAFSLIATAFLFGLAAFGWNLGPQLYGRLTDVTQNYVLAAVPLFVFMGNVLERSGLAEQLFDAMRLWLGRLPGGLGLATIAMCGIFAAATGIIGAVEIVVGMMVIGPMMRQGFDRGLIAGTICAGGSLGTIIPPSVLVVVYAGVAQLSVGELLAGIIYPGLIMVVAFALYILLRCWIRPQDGPREPPGAVPLPLGRKLAITVGALLPAAALVLAVLGSILAGVASPTEAAAVGALGSVLLACVKRRMNFGVLREAFGKTVVITAMMLLIVTGGLMFSGIFVASGGGRMLAGLLREMDLSPGMLIALFLLIVFLTGFVLDWVSIVLICVPLFSPFIKAAGIDPIWFAVMVMVVIQTSYMTPPMAPAIFYLRSIAPREITLGDMFRGVIPFILLEGLVLAGVWLYPPLATHLPRVLTGF